MVIHILGTKTEEKFFFVIQISVSQLLENCFWTIYCFWVYPRNYANWEFTFLMQQSHVQWHSSGVFFVVLIIWIYLKNIWKIKILPHLPRYLSCLFGLQKLKDFYNSDVIGNCMPSKWFKRTNCKIPHLKFFRFFQTVSDKLWEKLLLG